MVLYCNCLSLRQATRRVTQLYDQALAPVGLRATQFSLLMQVKHRGPVALNVLAEAMVMDRATLGHNVRPLELRGLIQLQVGEDRRSREVSITVAGNDKLAEAGQHWRRAQRTFERKLGRDAAHELRAALDRVAATKFALNA